MKKMYWTAHNLYPLLMIILCIVALLCAYTVEQFKLLKPAKEYKIMFKAATISNQAMVAVKKQRLHLGIKINYKYDPAHSGLIGLNSSMITSDHGVLRSKQIAVNPNIAALIVLWLKDLKLKPGSTVAIGMTGSFPGLNINTLAAIKALKLKPLIIVSATASQWGANIPRFMWLNMLHVLQRDKIFPYATLAASIGASKDRGANLEPSAIRLIKRTLKKYNIPLIEHQSVRNSISERLTYYQRAAEPSKVQAYINIGGGVASIGRHFVKRKLTQEQRREALEHSLKSGINLALPITLANTDSVAIRYLKLGIPVINLKDIKHIAEHYNLKRWTRYGSIGSGTLYYSKQYNLWLATGGLLIIFGVLVLIARVIKRKVIAENQM